jgi:hypothetical protein
MDNFAVFGARAHWSGDHLPIYRICANKYGLKPVSFFFTMACISVDPAISVAHGAGGRPSDDLSGDS